MTEQLSLALERGELADQAARDRMADDVGQRVIAVAGAGSGKTTQLVQRVLTTLTGTPDVPSVPASQVAVITFTDKAARELVHHLRGPAEGAIDDAYVGTIHGFCASILRSFPIEAGLPPKFSTADEITSSTDAEARVRAVIASVYRESARQPALREALAVVANEVGLRALPAIVSVIDRRWDQFDGLVLDPPSPAELEALHRAAIACGDEFVGGQGKSSSTLDKFIAGLEAARSGISRLGAAARLELPSLGTLGGAALKPDRDRVKEACAQTRALAHSIVLRRVVAAFQAPVLEHARRRIANGQLGYDDLLVLTRRLLTEHAGVRTELRRRYRRIFVDEFQDTDRVQFEIIRMLTDPDDDTPPPSSSPRLFAVGDPKQSIYGFRQAEVALFAELADAARADGSIAELTANFRTRADVASWINRVMRPRFDASGTAVSYESLVPQRPSTLAGEDRPGPPVVLLGVDASDDRPAARQHARAADAQRAEATDIVGVIERAVAEGWKVLDPDGSGGWTSRPARRRDISVLVARRTGLGVLEDALRQAGVPYRVEGGTLAYDRREVYELLRVLRAVANPADELQLVTALRTSILGCSDTDLFAYRHRQLGRRGTWRTRTERELPDAPAPGDEGDDAGVARVRRALARVEEWSRDAHRRGPAVLLAEIYDWSMGAAAARFEGEHTVSETWRRVRYLVDEARAWTDETGGTLAEYLEWVADKVEAVERAEIAPDETDEDAVRILTIHAAKGLEFPIVVVAGLGSKDSAAGDRFRVAFADGDIELRLGHLATPGFPARDPAAAEAEEARLLYVAMTRARDHLVVSCHTSKRSRPSPVSNLEPHLDLTGAECWGSEPLAAAVAVPRADELRGHVDPQPVDAAELAARPAADRRTVWTPSALAARSHDVPEGAPAEEALDDEVPNDAVDALPRDPGLQRDPASGLEVLRSRGRYGTDVGKAVHEVMQRVDLAEPTRDLDALVAAACDNVDLVDPEVRGRVAALSASIVASALFQRMRTAAVCEREIYVGAVAEVDGEPATIWGYADAVFQAGDGSYAVVDFKTDSSANDDDEMRERYSAQLNAYADVIERATGGAVGELWLLVGRAEGPAVEIAIARA